MIGQSGAGKTTLGRALAAAVGGPHIELDAFFHGPSWVPSPTFVDDVLVATSGERWVVDGNYTMQLGDRIWDRADTVVWLDLSRTVTLRRVLLRTVIRAVSRRPLWNDNRERVHTLLRASHPIRWTWQTYHRHRAAYEQRIDDPRWAHLEVVRLQSPAAVTRWLRDISGQGH